MLFLAERLALAARCQPLSCAGDSGITDNGMGDSSLSSSSSPSHSSSSFSPPAPLLKLLLSELLEKLLFPYLFQFLVILFTYLYRHAGSERSFRKKSVRWITTPCNSATVGYSATAGYLLYSNIHMLVKKSNTSCSETRYVAVVDVEIFILSEIILI